MIEDLYFPWKISEKYRMRFIKDTSVLGAEIEFSGYLVNIPLAHKFRKLLWPKLSLDIGDFSVRGITPLPESGFPLLLLVVPTYIKNRASIAMVEGKVLDFSMFSTQSGRFVLVNKITSIPPEKYFSIEKTGLSGRKIMRIMDATFSERAKDVMLSFFISSPKYINRVGGNALSFLKTNSKYYAGDFSSFYRIPKSADAILNHKTITVNLNYDTDMQVKLSPHFKIRYSQMKRRDAEKFYPQRKARLWEQSALTQSTVRIENLISYADIPFIPTKEETIVLDESCIQEYGLDIGMYAFEKHLETPEIDAVYVQKFKKKFIQKIDDEFPDIMEAMRLGVIMDIADVNGFGEHASRLISGWSRINSGDAVESILSLYLSIFGRIVDVMGSEIRKKVAEINMRNRDRRIINRVLWELNMLAPSGWEYTYFDEKMIERGYEKNPYTIFQKLLQDGYLIMKRKGIYQAVANI